MSNNSGADLYNKAKKIIPGGTQLLSKRPELFLPDNWPSYYDRASGCEIWDLDNNKYYDFSHMGVGACVLGYADEEVNSRVKAAVDKGTMTTLNCHEEVALARKMLELHPWADMARFARTGGEICAIAVRIARAATKKDKVAFCGYHGWHDWYISANLSDKNSLDGQLLPGLDPLGVPRNLGGTLFPFNYGCIDELEEIVNDNVGEIGVIMMEPTRNEQDISFLKAVRAVANRINAVLIFDEVTSGFRVNNGGIHLTLGVAPDLAVFGKALGNGFPISAVIGKSSIMDAAQRSFISSTFWTERIGFVAALATIEKMQRCPVVKRLVSCGKLINEGWSRIAQEVSLDISISGIEPLTHISFNYPNALSIQTLFTQEMLKRGFLAGSVVYTTYAYTDEIINDYIRNAKEVFILIKEGLNNNRIEKMLEGPIKHSGFKRLN